MAGKWLARAALLWLLATPLQGQATPSISQGQGGQGAQRRDVVSLREYIDIRLNALEEKIDAANAQRQLAIDKAEKTINERLESMNEFRAQLKDQAGQFATKEEIDQRAKVVDQRLSSIDNQLSSLNGSIKVLMGAWVLIQGAIVAWLKRSPTAQTRNDDPRA